MIRRDALRRLAFGLAALGGLRLYLPLAEAAPADAATDPGTEQRLALLIGNQRYPEPFDLPPIPKNVRDLREALRQRGFLVTDILDQDLEHTRATLLEFARRVGSAAPDATVLVYYSGHGVQVEATNMLLPAGLSPAAPGDQLRKGSVHLLEDVVTRLPPRQQGIVIAVVDACRTTLKLGDDAGLNQVEAPAGCLIAFSTSAGKPAIAPSDPERNTFYTGSLVKLLERASPEVTFAELFQLVRLDVRKTMQSHPVAAIRRLAQDPFIADHSLVRPKLKLSLNLGLPSSRPPAMSSPGGDVVTGSPPAAPAPPLLPKVDPAIEKAALAQVQTALWPADIEKFGAEFLARFPESPYEGSVVAAQEGAREAGKLLRRPDIRLFRSAFALSGSEDAEHAEDLRRASRGDKDAAARIGRRYRSDAGTGPLGTRYEGWLQYAAGLGNGIASYELAGYYRTADQPLLSARFEQRARDLGYTPPPSLDNVRK